jgi:hypothetical protein
MFLLLVLIISIIIFTILFYYNFNDKYNNYGRPAAVIIIDSIRLHHDFTDLPHNDPKQNQLSISFVLMSRRFWR